MKIRKVPRRLAESWPVEGDDCVEFAGRLNRNGYGEVRLGSETTGRVFLAHRIAFAIANGIRDTNELPAVVRHSCDNPRCVNPGHLLAGDHADNVADRVRRGRSAIGENNGRAKLSNRDVAGIKWMLAMKISAGWIARSYRVHRDTIGLIQNGVNWQSVGVGSLNDVRHALRPRVVRCIQFFK